MGDPKLPRVVEIIQNVMYFIQLLMFPMYTYVFWKNRKRDEKTPLYPILNHFFQVTVFFNFSYLLIFIISFLFVKIFHIDYSTPTLATFFFCILLVFFFLMFSIHCFAYVYHILLSFLAIQRFFLYFYPESEKRIAVGHKNTKRIVFCLYLFFAGREGYNFFKYKTLRLVYDYDYPVGYLT